MKRLLLSAWLVVAIGLVAPLLARNASIKSIEINQAIGVQKNGALKFVAGKETVVRAIMSGAVVVDAGHSSATVTKDGTKVITLAPVASASASEVDFVCPSLDACGKWAAGNYVFDVTVNGQKLSTSGTTYKFQERAGVRALALPVKANYGGVIQSVSGDSWKSTWTFTRSVYPVSFDGFTWTMREELDASDSSFDLETDAGRLKLWQALVALMPEHCLANKKATGCFDKIIGFIPARPGGFPNGNLQGYTYGNPGNIVVASDEDAAATVAHEIAHNYEIGDAYDGGSFNCTANPVPDAFSGKLFADPSQGTKCTAGRTQLGGVSGTLIPSSQHPYEVSGRGALGDAAEYMGSGGKQAQFWTTQDAYDWLFDKFALSSGGSSSAAAFHPQAGAATQRLIEFFGSTKPNPQSAADITLRPWEGFLDDDVVTDTTGTLMIAAVNAAGQRVATAALATKFDIPGPKGLPPAHFNSAEFAGAMKFPTGTTKFQILNGSTVIRELPVSANTPVVSGITMSGGSIFNGPTSIRWTGTDGDGDKLYYSIEYNPDVTKTTTDFEPIITFITGTQWTEDFSKIAGGDHAKLRIIATDGINASYTDSAEFKVPFSAPDVSAKALPQIAAGELTLIATVEDLQDGELPNSSIVWTSKKLGEVGKGAELNLKHLQTGADEFTVTATNSGGMKTSKTVAVTIVNTRIR